METIIRLLTKEGCLQIESISEAWCECSLVFGDTPIYLGAESPAYIKKHLLSGLGDVPPKAAGQIEGHTVSWVFSLAGANYAHVLYMATEGTDKLLYWQDAIGPVKIFCKMRLSQEERLEWRRQLEGP